MRPAADPSARAQVLIERDLIEVPVLDLQKLHRRAGALADAFWRLPEDERRRSPIPTCNTAGERIESEIRGLPAAVEAEAAATSDGASEDSVWC